MLAAGGSRGLALGHALRARRALLVVCGGRGGSEDPSRLTPSHLLSAGGRALTVLSGARQFEWRAVGKQMGGTLIVDDASHKEDVQKVPGAARAGSMRALRARVRPLPLPPLLGSSAARCPLPGSDHP